MAECDFVRRDYEPHADFAELWSFLKPLGFSVVSFYTGGVDDRGWRWGDVLFRLMASEEPGAVSCSPFAG